MAELGTLNIAGASGTTYQFTAYSLGTVFSAISAVYLITKHSSNPGGSGSYSHVYVGETFDLSQRFNNHHKMGCFKKHNANCVCVHPEVNHSSRLEKGDDIRQAGTFPCNNK